MTEEGLAQYERIAIDIASRISEGKIQEGQRLSGRTQLSSEYKVSPETVRKALALLSDMRVVSVKEKSGVTVISADNARRYIGLSRGRGARRALYEKLHSALAAYEETGKQIRDYELTPAPDNPDRKRSITARLKEGAAKGQEPPKEPGQKRNHKTHEDR